MAGHVDAERTKMFQDSSDEVRDRLSQAIRSVEESMLNRADEVFIAMSRDYRSVLGGRNASQGELMPEWQRSMQNDIMNITDSAEAIFQRAAGIYVEGEINEGNEIEIGNNILNSTVVKSETTRDLTTPNAQGDERMADFDSDATEDVQGSSTRHSPAPLAEDEIPSTPSAYEDGQSSREFEDDTDFE